jgi:16S rRNA (guanine527-N7)-methyltransferase
VEHSGLQSWALNHSISIDSVIEQKLLAYANLILETNRKYNLTGIKSIDGIVQNLIIGSIEPVIRLNVPRGTLYADIGSGAGIPGIPVGIIHRHLRGILIESNRKKSKFIISALQELQLDNLSVYCGRIEEYVGDGEREYFDVVFSRALGDPYYVLEMGAPLLKRNGILYIYSHLNLNTLPSHTRDHGIRLGLSIASDEERAMSGFDENGLLFVKKGDTATSYPRKISIIKRDIEKQAR